MGMVSFAKNTARSVIPAGIYMATRRGFIRLTSSAQPGRALTLLAPETVLESQPEIVTRRPNELELLGEKYHPTKQNHDYLKHYWAHFRDIRLDVKNVCEIGVQTDRSLRMWEEFFPNATIFGIDIDPNCKKFEGGRRKIFIGDQSDGKFLESFIKEIGGELDILIDDGSHIVEHQIKTFEILFPRLSSHGIYVIEDTGGVVGDVELYTVSSLKGLIDNIMYWPPDFDPVKWPELTSFDSRATWADRNIVGIAFYRWISFIIRGRNPEDNGFLGPS